MESIYFYQHPGWVIHLALEYLRRWNEPKPVELSKMELASVLLMKRTDEGVEAWMNANRGDYDLLKKIVTESGKFTAGTVG